MFYGLAAMCATEIMVNMAETKLRETGGEAHQQVEDLLGNIKVVVADIPLISVTISLHVVGKSILRDQMAIPYSAFLVVPTDT